MKGIENMCLNNFFFYLNLLLTHSLSVSKNKGYREFKENSKIERWINGFDVFIAFLYLLFFIWISRSLKSNELIFLLLWIHTVFNFLDISFLPNLFRSFSLKYIFPTYVFFCWEVLLVFLCILHLTCPSGYGLSSFPLLSFKNSPSYFSCAPHKCLSVVGWIAALQRCPLSIPQNLWMFPYMSKGTLKMWLN